MQCQQSQVDPKETYMNETHQAKSVNEKYCADCGALILLRAEICPKCGCRQNAAPTERFSVQADPATGPMIQLIACNFLWSGLGNILVGDKRGWGYGFFNWVIFALSLFTMFIPSLLFFAYCSWQGYLYLQGEGSEQVLSANGI
jgi:hypothetical protein